MQRVSVDKFLLVGEFAFVDLVEHPAHDGDLNRAGGGEYGISVNGNDPVAFQMADIDPYIPVKAPEQVLDLTGQLGVLFRVNQP
ncbi:hypothetical protein GCM10023187_15710 [Nibrella viscosa]|uniref:Uncharacterized protein n=1 Tax=Nibrella viscosa TaxID=1084524 RepID=A0ABP8K7Z8_9BACT